MSASDVGRAFLESAGRSSGVTPDPDAVLAERSAAQRFDVRPVLLRSVSRWRVGDISLSHDTGRFFSVEGVAVETNFGPTRRWTQPIILQPEIGILGFLAKRIDGTLHLLAQAKMEPGNLTAVQFSPTVQATPSNYTRVHGGKETPHLHYFLEPSHRRVLVDQLQSEQGSRYYHKRNRNMVVEVPSDEVVTITSDFVWLALSQFHALLAAGNRVNMNARTVLSCLPYAGEVDESAFDDPFRFAALESSLRPGTEVEFRSALDWFTRQQHDLRLVTKRIRLADLDDWIVDDESIRHSSGRFFQVIGVAITAESREVDTWMQPMLAPTCEGSIAFLCQRRAGVLHFLVQARVEPGFMHRVELGPTLQFSPGNYCGQSDLPHFAEYLACPPGWLRMRATQSQDGGRFYHDQPTHLVIELPEDEVCEVPSSYRWMTLGMLQRMMRCGCGVDIEARSLMSCLA